MSNTPEVVMMPSGSIVNHNKTEDFKGWSPNPKCKKCYGRGWTGKYLFQELKIHMVCKCVKKQEGTLVCNMLW